MLDGDNLATSPMMCNVDFPLFLRASDVLDHVLADHGSLHFRYSMISSAIFYLAYKDTSMYFNNSKIVLKNVYGMDLFVMITTYQIGQVQLAIDFVSPFWERSKLAALDYIFLQ